MPHELPELPYPGDALEPYLGEQTLRIHHDRHHQGYVDALNEAETAIERAREANDLSRARSICDALAFNYSGHLFHSIYWQCMSPDGGGDPTGPLAQQINRDFGSVAGFRAHFVAAANAVQASGWAVLAWQPLGQRLVVLQAEKHQDLAEWGVTPLLVLDVWEHAYYLDYQNERPRFTEGFFEVINWDYAGRRFERA